MSDEFIELATNEINEELKEITVILGKCSNDSDISNSAKSIASHLHKIKGLAPMIKKNEVGQIASIHDTLLRKIIDGQTIVGIYQTICDSNSFMKKAFNNSKLDKSFIQNLKNNYSEFLD